jgi:PhnB protein
MPSKASPIPQGLHTVTPHLVIKGAAKAIDFYKKAFGAEEIVRMPAPDGNLVMHAQLKIGDSMIMLADEFPQGGCNKSPASAGSTTVVLHLYVQDADAVFNKATAAGAKVIMPLMDMFWGDRYGQVSDPFGHVWSIATHKEDLTPQEMAKRQKEFFARQPGQH